MSRVATKNQDERSGYQIIKSDVTAVASNITVTAIPATGNPVYVGFNTFSNSAGTTPAAATAGTVDISIKTAVSNQAFEEVAADVSMIQADLATTKIDSGPVTLIRAVPDTAITGGSVSHYQMVVWTK